MPPGSGSNLVVVLSIHNAAQVNGYYQQSVMSTTTPTFSYDFPTISNIIQNGSTITIVGTNFGPPSNDTYTTINIGDTSCFNVLHISHTELQCYVADGLGSNLVVTVSIGGVTSLPSAERISSLSPIIRQVSPAIIPLYQQTSLEVDRDNFGVNSSGLSVVFG